MKRRILQKAKKIKHADIVRGFAVQLRLLRLKRGLSQAEVAAKSGVHVTYLSRLERGEASPGLDLMDRVAVALEVPVTELIPARETDPLALLQDQARRRLESIIRHGDVSSLGILNPILAMIDDMLARGH